MDAERRIQRPGADEERIRDAGLVVKEGIPGIPGISLRRTLEEDCVGGLEKAQIDLIPGRKAREKARRAFLQGADPSEAAADYLMRTEVTHKGRR